jgi:shikimate kinase
MIRFGPRVRPSTLVELIGLPGAGKSSVFGALVDRSPKVERHDAPELGDLGFGALLATLPSILETLVSSGAIRGLTPAQLQLMVYLRALPRVVARGAPGDGSILVLDQGPFYLLDRPLLMDERLANWREEVFETSAAFMDAVVWLDAPDSVLVERIAGRRNWHRLKEAHPSTALASLARTRAVHEQALSKLKTRLSGPVILHFDTSRVSSGEIADAILQTVGGAIPIVGGSAAARSETRA